MLIDVRSGETEQEAEARAAAESLVRIGRAMDAELADRREAARLAAEPGAAPAASAPDYVDSEDETAREGWHIRDLSTLDWALSRIADLEVERAENKALVERAIDRLQLRLEKLNASAERGISFFRSHVEAYAQGHRAELLKGGKARSRKLPHGSVGWRRVGARATAADKDALLAWAREQPIEEGWVRVREEAAWDKAKKHVEATGELLPGVELQPEREEFQIKPIGEE